MSVRCYRHHTDVKYCGCEQPFFGPRAKDQLPIGKVTGFELKPIPITEISLAGQTRTTVELSETGDIEFHKWEKVQHSLKLSEARAMERAVMLGFKIVVSPNLKGAETEIHVSQERYDELKGFLPEGEI